MALIPVTKDKNQEVPSDNRLYGFLERNEVILIDGWMRDMRNSLTRREDLISEKDLRKESTNFVRLLREGIQSGNFQDIEKPEWTDVRSMLTDLSQSRAEAGFSPSETVMFIFSFKQPLYQELRKEFEKDPETLASEFRNVITILDRFVLFVSEAYQKTRDAIISRQQQELLELSTPVVQLWEGILALPMIGTLDSARTQTAMEALLQQIVETGSQIAIIDITGVPTVDTLVAQHLIKTVTAARLMGADCIISGIRPQIAATIVHLGLDLGNVTTKANLADAFVVALQRTGKKLSSNVEAA